MLNEDYVLTFTNTCPLYTGINNIINNDNNVEMSVNYYKKGTQKNAQQLQNLELEMWWPRGPFLKD